MSDKKIGFLLEFFPPNNLSSAILPFSIVEEMVKKSFKVTVITGYETNNNFDKKYTQKTKNQVTIHRIKYYKAKNNKFKKLFSMISFFINTLFKLKYFKNHHKVFVFSNPPINNLLGLIAKKLYKVSLIFVVYDIYPDIALFTNQIKKNSIIYNLFEYINHKIYDGSNSIVVLSIDMKEYLSDRYPRLLNSIQIIPNWFVDKSDIFTNSYKKDIKINLGYFGNLGITQDINILKTVILFFKNHKKIFFTFAIHGNQKKDLDAFVKTNKITNIQIHNFLSENDYLKKLSIQDYILVTLNKNINKVASPSRIYSFMMMGKPILFFDHSESSLSNEIQKYKLGFFINTSKKDVIDTFSKILNQTYPFNRDHIMDHFRKNYTPEINIQKYINLIE